MPNKQNLLAIESPMEASGDLKQGVSGIVSAKESDKQSQDQSKKLQEFLHDSGFFESEEFAQTRERVLGRLDFMVKSFVSGIPGGPENPGGKIFTFGSYRLGVHDRGADIDALCVVPRHVTRRDFFSIFYEQLQENQAVDEITKVEDSYVPLIKMKFHGISIDVTFARLGVSSIRDNINLLNDTILRSMDEKCIVSLNGSRVTDAILSLVPSPEVFHGALRAIKLWAKRRMIYGATYGYFGGVAYAICVARICQMYPSACSFDILKHFFEQFSIWKWPSPVLLRPVVDLNYHLKVWNPKVNPVDRYHKMPVITPAYPSMCSTHNVTQSTSAHITSELVRGNEILKGGEFASLFDQADFTKKYKLFLEVSALATSDSEFLMWSGFVESKLRTLAGKLEGVENISAALIIPKCFKGGDTSAVQSELIVTGASQSEPTNSKLDGFTKAKTEKYSSTPDTCSTSSNACLDRDVDGNSTNKRGESSSVYLSSMDDGKQELNSTTPVGPINNVPENDGGDPKIVGPAPELELSQPSKHKLSNDDESRKVLKTENNSEEMKTGEEGPRRAMWFIALNVLLTSTTSKKLYIDGPIRDFLKFMNSWEHKTTEMSIKVNPCKKKEVQSFMK